MKKTLIALSLIASMAQADYEVFETYTKPLNQVRVVKSTTLFVGELKDYATQMAQVNKGTQAVGGALQGLTSQAPTLLNSLGSAGAGLGIGLVAGLLSPMLYELGADQQFIKVVKMEDSQGRFTLKRTLLVGNKNPSLSIEQVKSILGGN